MQGMTSLCIKVNMNLWTSISIKAFSPSYVIFANIYCDNPRALGVSFGFCVVVGAVLCSAGADWGNWLHDLHLGPVSLAVKAFFFLQRVSHLLSDSFCLPAWFGRRHHRLDQLSYSRCFWVVCVSHRPMHALHSWFADTHIHFNYVLQIHQPLLVTTSFSLCLFCCSPWARVQNNINVQCRQTFTWFSAAH